MIYCEHDNFIGNELNTTQYYVNRCSLHKNVDLVRFLSSAFMICLFRPLTPTGYQLLLLLIRLFLPSVVITILTSAK